MSRNPSSCDNGQFRWLSDNIRDPFRASSSHCQVFQIQIANIPCPDLVVLLSMSASGGTPPSVAPTVVSDEQALASLESLRTGGNDSNLSVPSQISIPSVDDIDVGESFRLENILILTSM